MAKHCYAALARVSSREQEREGFSLEVQEDALHRFADQHDGEIIKFYKIAETASKRDERKVFKELLTYCRTNANKIDGLLFFKVDRAARNIFDYVELERLEADYGVKVIYVSQPTENTPAGHMMRRTLANMAAFYTEQQSLDVKEGHARRVGAGLFVSRAVYGYANLRIEGRSLVQIHPEHGPKVTLLFEQFARGGNTIESIGQELADQGVIYTVQQPRFSRSKLHVILTDRSYIGEVRYRDQWYPGTHTPLVNHPTFSRVAQLLGGQVYRAHEMLFASELIRCGPCGHPITGECKIKVTSKGPREYTYYRCARYNTADHPRVRLSEGVVEAQVLAIFDGLRIKDEAVRAWFGGVLQARLRDAAKLHDQQHADRARQLSGIAGQQERLLNLRLANEIDEATFAKKSMELRDRIALLSQELGRDPVEHTGITPSSLESFELAQSLLDKWATADFKTKRQLLESVFSDITLRNETIEAVLRKPFDLMAEGLNRPV